MIHRLVRNLDSSIIRAPRAKNSYARKCIDMPSTPAMAIALVGSIDIAEMETILRNKSMNIASSNLAKNVFCRWLFGSDVAATVPMNFMSLLL